MEMLKEKIIPNNYWVLLLPWLFPWWLEIFQLIIKEINLDVKQIIDGSYNSPQYYENNMFSLEKYSQYITLEVEKARKKFDKIMSSFHNFCHICWNLPKFIQICWHSIESNQFENIKFQKFAEI